MRREAPTWLKPTVEYAPLAVFFIAYWLGGLMVATAALMVATAIAIALSLAVARHVPIMPIVTAAVVGVFGALTLLLNDETFIKMKPTIVQVLFAVVLIGGLAIGKPPLKYLVGAAFPMDDAGWRGLTLRFAIFFVAMAALNEFVWRTQSTDFWVNFKVFGLLALTFIFVALQLPFMTRHRLPASESPANER
ncbi:MAG: septation protein A [Alphaproteobacteria bacterium]|nr:septation protein A [Alphaproteobacteria bacterium]